MRIVVTILSLVLLSTVLFPFSVFSEIKEEEKFQIAAKAFSDDFYDASLSLFKKFVEDFPDSSLLYKAKLYIAKCYYYKEDYAKALEAFTDIERSESVEEAVSEACYWLSVIYFRGKDFKEVLSYAQKIIDSYPNSVFIWNAYYLAGVCNLELGEQAKAEEVFGKIVSECEQEDIVGNAYSQILSVYLQNQKYDRIISLGEKYLKGFPRGSLRQQVYFYLGESYYIKGEWDKALGSYQSALRNISDLELKDSIYQGIGFTYIEKGDKIAAKSSVDKIKNKELRLFSQGVYYLKAGDYIQALETVNIFIRDYPESGRLIEVYLHKADLLYEMGRLNDSISVYSHILDNFDQRQYSEAVNKAHYGLAWCYLKSGKFKKAINEFENTLKYSDNPVVKASSRIQIADAYQETGKYSEALDIYNSILKNQPNTVYADYVQFQIGMCFLKKKDLEKAFLALKNLKNNFPSSKLISQVQYYLAVGYFSREDYAEARNLLSDFIDKFPRDDFLPKANYLYGKCFFNEKNYKQALTVFKKTAERFKDTAIAELVYIDIGNTYLNLSLFDEAKKIWKGFLVRYPNSQYAPSVALYLGGLYEKEEKYIEAEEYYHKIIDDYRDSPLAQESLLSLGHLYWSRGNLEKAQSCFKRLSERQIPLALKAKLYLAQIFFQEGQYRKALNLYNELAEVESPITKVALSEKAFLLKEIKDYDQAIGIFERAIAEGADSPEIRFTLGLCLEKVDRGEEAVEEYLKAIYAFSGRNDSGNGDSVRYDVKAYFRIARIYEKSGKNEEAGKIYRKIISLGVEEGKIAGVRLKALNIERNSKP